MEKISREIAEIVNNKGFAEAIGAYIETKCKKDESFSKRVMMKEKELEQCLKYILSEVRKGAKSSLVVSATDDEVFKLVDDYYQKDNKDLQIDEKVNAATQVTTQKTTYAKVDPPEKVEVKKPEKKSILTKKVKERDPLIDNQVSVFDLLG